MATFSSNTIKKAWDGQKGLCAYCEERLSKEDHDLGSSGAWEAHHRKPRSREGLHSLGNCALLCINPPNKCHLKIGHRGDYKKRVILCDYELPYLYGGAPFTPLDKIYTPLDKIKTPLDRIKPLL